MVKLKKCFIWLTVLCMVCALAPGAWADGEQPPETAQDGASRFASQSWDEAVRELLAKWNTPEDAVGVGYRNTVTGEEHYINGDTYFDAASMFKVPLNMYYTEKIARGEMEPEDSVGGMNYRLLMEATILNSSNEAAVYLWNGIGGYRDYRTAIAPYMGVDPDNVDHKYYANNYFTPEQEINCLDLLAREPERFPRLIDCMKQAEPENYFARDEKRFEIAHKYGRVQNDDDWQYYLNDSAVVYTDEPIVIVMFTRSAPAPYDLLAEYCTLMCDYAQYHTARDAQTAQSAQEQAETELKSKINEAVKPEPPALTPAASGEDMVTDSISLDSLSFGALALLVLILVAAIVAVIFVIKLKLQKKIRLLWGLLAVVFAAAGFGACALGATMGTLVTVPDGDPQETAERFFSAVVSGDYAAAYACLDDYSDLGLAAQPEDPVGQRFYAALRESYSYTLVGDCRTEGLHAGQQVQFTYFDLTKIAPDLESDANAYLEELVSDLNRSQIYDANDRYLPEITDQVYAHAVDSVLAHEEDYYSTVLLDVELTYTDGTWSLSTSQPMLRALTGGTV